MTDTQKKEIQALIIPENFTKHLHPLNDSTNDILLPIASVPFIEYLTEYLLNAGVTQIIICLKNNSQTVKDYVKNYFKDLLKKNSKLFHFVCSEEFNSVGDCLRETYKENLISSDFILIRGLTITNFNLEKAFKAHLANKKEDKSCLVTSLFKRFKNDFGNKTNYDKNVLILDKTTKRILQYESIDGITKLKLNENINFSGSKQPKVYEVRANIYDTFIDICAPEILNHFCDNFDYCDVRDNLYKKYLVSDMYLDTFYFYEIGMNDYCNTIKNMESYLKTTVEIINRWAHPLFSLDNISISQKLGIKYVYTHGNVYLGTGKGTTQFVSHLNLARLSSISDFRTSSQVHNNDGTTIQVSADYTTNICKSVVGSLSNLAENTSITNSIIGKRCEIGKGAIIKNSVILDECEIGDNVKIINSVICTRTKVSKGIELIEDSYLGEGLDINLDNEKISLENRKELVGIRMHSENSSPDFKSITNTITKVNENPDNILDSDEEDNTDSQIAYTIVTHKDFFRNLDEQELKYCSVQRNFNFEDSNFDGNDDNKELDKSVNSDKIEKVDDNKNEAKENDDFTESESEENAGDDDIESPIHDIFEKKGEPVSSTQELVMLRKAYWDNKSAECKYIIIIIILF